VVIILQERANIDNSAFSKTKTLLSFKVADALYATACGDGHVLLKVSGIHASFLKLLTILKDMQQLLLLAGGECHSMAIAATSYIVFIKWHSKLITWCSKTGCLLICSAWPSLACLCRAAKTHHLLKQLELLRISALAIPLPCRYSFSA